MPPPVRKAVESRPSPLWVYVMMSANAKTVTAFLQGARASGQPFSVLAGWLAITAHIELDTGILTCSQRQLARTAGMTIGEMHRAIDKLVEMGALLREERGKYRVHPSIMWRGQLERRGQAEANAPVLTLVDGGKTD